MMSERKKICHVEITPIDSMPRVWRGAIAAKENGYEVVVIGEGKTTEYNSIRFIGFPYMQSRIKRIFIRSKKMIDAAIKENPDVVEIHSPEMLLFYKRIKRRDIKILFNSHEFYKYQILEKPYLPLWARKMISFVYGFVERYICKKIDGVIYPCTFEGKNYFEKITDNSIKIENFSMLVPGSDIILPKISKSIIYAGSLTEARGITTLVNVANRIDCQLYLCGVFPSSNYEDYIRNIMNPDKIHYMGNLKREDLFQLYSQMCVGVSLLKKVGQYDRIDNLSTKIYEFMSCGLPIVCSSMQYACRTNDLYNYALTVDPSNEVEVQRAIERLLADATLAKTLGDNGRNAIENVFSWDKEKIRLIAYYNALFKDNTSIRD